MIFCGLGRECVDSEGEPFCDCIQKCSYMEPPTPVCGSDDVTYQSECELHREACVMNKQIAVKTRMPCKREGKIRSDLFEGIYTREGGLIRGGLMFKGIFAGWIYILQGRKTRFLKWGAKTQPILRCYKFSFETLDTWKTSF